MSPESEWVSVREGEESGVEDDVLNSRAMRDEIEWLGSVAVLRPELLLRCFMGA